MLAIKLKRTGKKHQSFFRIIVIEKRSKMKGVYTDNLGWVNPHTKKIQIDKDKSKQWLAVGAQPTPTVHNLFVKSGITLKPKIPVHSKKKTEKSG